MDEETKELLTQTFCALERIAVAQERLVELAEIDLEESITQAIESRAEDRAQEIVAENTKRSFIGKKGA